MDDGPGRPGLVAVAGRVLRWHPRSYWQIWLIAAAGYPACAAACWLAGAWPRHGAAAIVALAGAWLGFGTLPSYYLERRRNGGRVSEAKPPQPVPGSPDG
jgi:hypothetical protein